MDFFFRYQIWDFTGFVKRVIVSFVLPTACVVLVAGQMILAFTVD